MGMVKAKIWISKILVWFGHTDWYVRELKSDANMTTQRNATTRGHKIYKVA